MLSKKSHNIKNRENPKDVFITPKDLAKKHIDLINHKEDDIWYDPFRNSGVYYKQFPTDKKHKKWSEILKGKDFFEFDKKIDIICSNPPYSLLNKVFEHSIKLNPRVISYLIGINNLTPRRIEMMNNAGYGLTTMYMTNVWRWFGMSVIVVFEKDKDNIIMFDRTTWRDDDKKPKKKIVKKTKK